MEKIKRKNRGSDLAMSVIKPLNEIMKKKKSNTKRFIFQDK